MLSYANWQTHPEVMGKINMWITPNKHHPFPSPSSTQIITQHKVSKKAIRAHCHLTLVINLFLAKKYQQGCYKNNIKHIEITWLKAIFFTISFSRFMRWGGRRLYWKTLIDDDMIKYKIRLATDALLKTTNNVLNLQLSFFRASRRLLQELSYSG